MKKLPLFCTLYFVLCIGATFAYTSEDTSNANYLADQQIVVKQTIASKYRLDDKILRQEVIAMALKVKGITLPENYTCKKYFTDVTSSSDWVCRAIEIAADNGIITRSNKYANPSKYVTRAEALAMVMKAGGITIDTFNQDYFNTNFHGLSDVYWTDSYKFSSTWMRDVFFSYMKYVNIDVPGQGQKKISDSGSSSFNYRIDSYATRAEVFGFARNIINTQGEEGCDNCGGFSNAFTADFPAGQPIREIFEEKTVYSFGEKYGLGTNAELGWRYPFYITVQDTVSFRQNVVNKMDLFEKLGTWKNYTYYQNTQTGECGFESIIFPGKQYTITVSLGGCGEQDTINDLLAALGDINFDPNSNLNNLGLLPKGADVLATYYLQLQNWNTTGAYKMRSPITESLATFQSWYKNLEIITFREDTLKSLGDNTYEFLVDMTDNGVKSTYKVKSKVNLEKFTIDNISSVKQ